MPRGWTWDETLYRGSAPYYLRGRQPYAHGLPEALAGALDLSGDPRLIDAGCGPGVIALQLAHLFTEVVGVDPDADMLIEAERAAAEAGVPNARWLRLRAEELPAGLGPFRCATFGRSFHWMERERVAALVFDLLEANGAFVHVDPSFEGVPPLEAPLPHPEPPAEAIAALAARYLGEVRRAGSGFLRYGTPDGEALVLEAAGFLPPQRVRAEGRQLLERTVDDVVASVFSGSGTAPHLFGGRLEAFERDLRGLLDAASPGGLFSERTGDTDLVIYRRPPSLA